MCTAIVVEALGHCDSRKTCRRSHTFMDTLLYFSYHLKTRNPFSQMWPLGSLTLHNSEVRRGDLTRARLVVLTGFPPSRS